MPGQVFASGATGIYRAALRLLPPDTRADREDMGRAFDGLWQDVRGVRARGGMLEAVATELITGARSLSRRPGLAVGTVLTIAVGIAATTTIYGVVDGVVLRPLPYHEPSTLVRIGATARGGSADPDGHVANHLRALPPAVM